MVRDCTSRISASRAVYAPVWLPAPGRGSVCETGARGRQDPGIGSLVDKTKTLAKEVLGKNTAGERPTEYDGASSRRSLSRDVVILTMAEGVLHALLVRRGEEPFRACGRFRWVQSVPRDAGQAARRELSRNRRRRPRLPPSSALRRSDRDPGMNGVPSRTSPSLATWGAIVAGTDAGTGVVPPRHLGERWSSRSTTCKSFGCDRAVRVEPSLGHRDGALSARLTMPSSGAVYERYGACSSTPRTSAAARERGGWVIPKGRTARPGPGGGRPAGCTEPGGHGNTAQPSIAREGSDR